MNKCFLIFCIVFLYRFDAYSQIDYSLSLHFDSFDPNSKRACYILKIKNESNVPWSVGDQNYSILYNTKDISLTGGLTNSFLPLSSYSPLKIISNIENVDSSNVGELPFNDNFGILNFSIEYDISSSQPIEIEPDSSLVIAKLCYIFLNPALDNNICTPTPHHRLCYVLLRPIYWGK